MGPIVVVSNNISQNIQVVISPFVDKVSKHKNIQGPNYPFAVIGMGDIMCNVMVDILFV